MRIQHFKVYNQIHTWTGIIAGLFLFICFIGGALTMFKTPLNQWALQADASLAPIAEEKYDDLIQQVLQQHPEAAAEMTVYLPRAQPQHAPVSWVIENHETHATTIWHATLNDNNELVTAQASVSAVGDFIDDLHRTAGIPGGDGHDAVGTYVMGIVAGLYFLALVSGLIIFLPSWFKDLFSVRRGKNRKRFWVDFHNVLGISALPFHIVIALTTMVFAFHDLFYGSLQALVYKDTPMFNAPPAGTARQITELASINELTQSIQTLEPEFKPAVITFRGLNSPRASAIFGGEMEGHWIRGPDYAFVVSNPYTTQPGYTAMLPNQPGSMGKFVNGFFALHFGGFGGDTIRWVYFGLGVSGALLFLSGNILWIETRRRRQKQNEIPVEQKKSCVTMARLTVGVALGTLMGLALSLLIVKWLPHSQVDIAWWQNFAYYSGFLVCIGWAFICPPLHAAKQQLLVLCVLTSVLTVSSVGLGRLSTISLVFAFVALIITAGLLATLGWVKKREKTLEKDSAWI
ncbi:PepSY-associated TM helix domain-containing protein [Teredinibacter sp. KSP-S5-2]|uniref:PepSY-associated TM helix domain-containing protein n=1 Tax=Teredinibacter sp. KSP-S5-2 TaxID=3034506 RepID=UPI0029343E25|nr:PepSY-associated TM helix domain-containing protein [Teredinibacter sp. KSP-S5-2]WNO11465.1 PepSY-associated TM helix domain-containing protein [Teredinibacter sp. KSP-S5-2]